MTPDDPPPPPPTPTPPAPPVYRVDDRVINTARPAWGSGVVVRARAHTHAGVRCQMLSVRFDRAGLKQLSTGVAPLRHADAGGAAPSSGETPDHAPDPRAGRTSGTPALTASALSQLPNEITDTGIPAPDRLRAALAQFVFVGSRTSEALAPNAPSSARPPTPDQRVLLDWAISRSGVTDPLAQLNRTELEAAYDAFVRRLHDQLRPLIRAAASEDLAAFARVVESAPPTGREAARRALPAANTGR